MILLRDVEELSTADAAQILDVTEDVVKTRLHRARLERFGRFSFNPRLSRSRVHFALRPHSKETSVVRTSGDCRLPSPTEQPSSSTDYRDG